MGITMADRGMGGNGEMKKFYEVLKGYVQELKSGEKKFSKDGMLIVFFSGLLIYVILLPINNNKSYEMNKKDEQKVENSVNSAETHQEKDYQTKLEEELEEFLAKVKGIGEVEVLIYLNATQEYVVEKDIPSHQVISEDENGKSSEENKEEDTVYRNNKIFRSVVDKVTGNEISKDLIKLNHAKVMYDTSNLVIREEVMCEC